MQTAKEWHSMNRSRMDFFAIALLTQRRRNHQENGPKSGEKLQLSERADGEDESVCIYERTYVCVNLNFAGQFWSWRKGMEMVDGLTDKIRGMCETNSESVNSIQKKFGHLF